MPSLSLSSLSFTLCRCSCGNPMTSAKHGCWSKSRWWPTSGKLSPTEECMQLWSREWHHIINFWCGPCNTWAKHHFLKAYSLYTRLSCLQNTIPNWTSASLSVPRFSKPFQSPAIIVSHNICSNTPVALLCGAQVAPVTDMRILALPELDTRTMTAIGYHNLHHWRLVIINVA